MAETVRATDALANKLIDVKILSQLAHPHGTIHFHAIRANTSVHQLRAMVHNVISARSSPQSLRFIYQGRALTRESDTLIDVFGKQALEQTPTHTLHLVVREQMRPSSTDLSSRDPVTRSAMTTSNHTSSQQPVDRTTQPVSSQENYQDVPQAVPHSHHTHNTGVAPYPQMPAITPQSPFGASTEAGHSFSQYQRPESATHPMQSISDFQSMIQQQVTHQRQMAQAFAASQPGIGATPSPYQSALGPQSNFGQINPSPTNNENTARLSRHFSSSATSNVGTGEANERGSNSLSREDLNVTSPQETAIPELNSRRGFGANGSTWTFTSSSTYSPMQAGTPYAMQPHMATRPTSFPAAMFGHNEHAHLIPLAPAQPHRMGYGVNRLPSPYSGWLGPAHAIDYMENTLGQLEATLRLFRTLTETISSSERSAFINNNSACLRAYVAHRNRAQQIINYILAHGPPRGHTAPTAEHIATLQSLNERFQSVVRSFWSELRDIPYMARDDPSDAQNRGHESGPAPDGPESDTANRTRVSTSRASNTVLQEEESSRSQSNADRITVYILNSAQGPQAILYSQDGVFSNRSTNYRPRISLGHAQGDVDRYTRLQATVSSDPPGHAVANQDQGNPRMEHVAPQRQGRPQQEEANAIAINLTPFFQALWLFIRGYAFMWLFLGGRGSGEGIMSWRSIFLLALSFAYWAVQAGIGAEQIGLVRHHWDELVGLNPVPREARGGQGGEDAQLPVADPAERPELGAQPRGRSDGQPQPRSAHGQGTAHGRPESQRRPHRELLRSLQRTAALFLASLYPGIGERHVAQQDRVRREAQELDRARAAATAAQEDAAPESTADQSGFASNAIETNEPGSSAAQGAKTPSEKFESVEPKASTESGQSSAEVQQDGANLRSTEEVA